MKIEAVILEGQFVRLEPLAPTHAGPLSIVGLDPDLWKWTIDSLRTPEEMRAWVQKAVDEAAAGRALPFATIERATATAIGSTRFMNIAMPDKRVEIGSTWVAGPWQRTAANTEAKLLMLRHAFETLGCIRVELKTDRLNERSRNAIRRIGGVEEGILRQHMITSSGRLRDSVYYSILDSEWPAVRDRLEARLGLQTGGTVSSSPP
jgi:RimJ/RimL family protein N-acetyltransferase